MKIGSAVDIDKRLAYYQTACPHRSYRLEASAYVENRRKAETDLMKTLRQFKHQGEWFRIETPVVTRMLDAMQQKNLREAGGT